MLGFGGLSLLLPQALAGIGAVAVLYHLVARTFGRIAGSIAALVLATTPIAVAADRNNTVEAQLLLVLLLAAWALFRYHESARLGWLAASMALVGLGFGIKMLEAYVALPAFIFLALVASRGGIARRAMHVLAGALVLLAASFWWPVAVDLTPPEARPFVGSSRDNTELGLVFGHNGIERILGPGLALFRPQPGAPPGGPLPPGGPPSPLGPVPPPPPPPTQAGPGGEIGSPGPLRLLNVPLGGQASWLLAFALVGAAASLLRTRLSWPLATAHVHVLFWSAWLVPQLVAYSAANLIHRYYLELAAPAIAALVGIGAVALWRSYREGAGRGSLLPIALVLCAVNELVVLAGHPDWGAFLAPLAVGAPVALAVALALVRSARRRSATRAGPPALYALALLSSLVAPLAWALTPVVGGADAGLPFAGPELLARQRPRGPVGIPQDEALTRFLLASRSGERFILATQNAGTAAPFIVATGEPVMALGGFSGSDRILAVDDLRERVRRGDVRFFLVPRVVSDPLLRWVIASCRAVPAERWRPGPSAPTLGPGGPQDLFDCAGAWRAAVGSWPSRAGLPDGDGTRRPRRDA